METTGVVRRIDELGRIVIPKEIRRTLGIKDGSSLEIYVDKDVVALKKHSTMSNLVELASIYTESVYATLKRELFITDCDNIISCPNTRKKEFLNKQISKYLDECIKERKEDIKKLSITEEKSLSCSYMICPISANGDIIGLVILTSETKIKDSERNIAIIASQFLGKNIEE